MKIERFEDIEAWRQSAQDVLKTVNCEPRTVNGYLICNGRKGRLDFVFGTGGLPVGSTHKLDSYRRLVRRSAKVEGGSFFAEA